MTRPPDAPTDLKVQTFWSEDEAASVLHIKPRSLRTERKAGRLGYQPVAGKIMYRESDLIEWQQTQGIKPCRDQTKDRDSSLSVNQDASGRRIISDSPKMVDHASVARARASSSVLKKSSLNSCSTKAKNGEPGQVVRLIS